MNRGTIIVNPAAGRGRGIVQLRQFVSGGPLESWDWHETKGPGDAFRIARSLANDDQIVAAAGGDGTVSEVAAALSGRVATLALLPVGTGNDLARTLGIGASLPRALTAIESQAPRRVDMMRWTNRAGDGLGVNVAGSGFDAVVARRINEGYRYLRGTTAYVAAVLGSLRTFQPARLHLEIDGIAHETTAMLCAIANAKSYGGGMRVAPNAELDDGLLDVVVVEGLSRTAFLRAFPRVFAGTHVSHPKVRVFRGRNVFLRTESPLPVLNDGELIGETPVRFEVLPGVLKVLSL